MMFSPQKPVPERRPKSISAHFGTKLKAVSKKLVHIASPSIDRLQQACSMTKKTPVSTVLPGKCPLTDSNILW
jgi:hypothetical protein